MKSATRGSWLACVMVVVGMLIVGGVGLTGCSPAKTPSKKTDEKDKKKPAKKTPDTPKDEPKEKPKDEPKEKPKDEPKDKPKDEPKDKPKDEPKDTPKDEPKEKPKEEPKKAPALEGPKKAPIEEAPKKEEPKKDVSATAPAPVNAPVASTQPVAMRLSADAPAVSSFAPAEDLENQMADYLKDLQSTVASEQEYKDAPEGKLARDANTVIVIALALGLHDKENKYKAGAAALMKAAAVAAAAKDYASAKKAVEAVVAAAAASGGGQLKWEKVAALDQLMKQVPLVHTKLKMKTEGSRFKSKAKDTTGYSAVIAAIAQASIADTTQAKNAGDVQKWQAFCVQMREAAAAVNAGVHKQDRDAADAAMAKLQQSCDDCHKVFHQAALEKTKGKS